MLKSKKKIAPRVSALSLSISPVAIIFGIALVIVYTVYLKPLLVSFNHVSDEGFNIVPMFADSDTTTAIIGVTFVLWLFASFYHAAPHPIKRVLVSSVFGHSFFVETTATRCFSSFQHCWLNIVRFASAIALAFCKILVSSGSFMQGKNGVPAISLAWLKGFRFPRNEVVHVVPPVILNNITWITN